MSGMEEQAQRPLGRGSRAGGAHSAGSQWAPPPMSLTDTLAKDEVLQLCRTDPEREMSHHQAQRRF